MAHVCFIISAVAVSQSGLAFMAALPPLAKSLDFRSKSPSMAYVGLQGQQRGSAGKSTCHQSCWSEFNPRALHTGEENQISLVVLRLDLRTMACMCLPLLSIPTK